MYKYIFVFLISASLFYTTHLHAQYQRISCVMHIDSLFSGNEKNPLSLAAQEAAEKKIDVLIPGDHALMRWEYGVWPLRNILHKVIEKNSVLHSGPRAYLAELKRLETLYPDLMIIPGVEAAAHYYWSGNPFSNGLTMHQWHKHMLVIGMENPDDYMKLPLTSNPYSGSFNVHLLWPLLLLIPGLLLLRYKHIALLFIVLSILCTVNNYPFSRKPYTPYMPDAGEKPYQDLIDYARARGALTFWAHPEAPNFNEPISAGPVSITTEKYDSSILHTYNYTGFALYGEGYRTTGSIGGYWDQTLMQYCSKQRKHPVWAVGELDYSKYSEKRVDGIQNVIWVQKKTKQDVLNGLKNGNFYISLKHGGWFIDLQECYLHNAVHEAVCGQEIDYIDNPVRIVLNMKASDNNQYPATIQIIRNGKVLQVLESMIPARIVFEDTSPIPFGKNYYRIVINNKIFTNPMFLNRTGEETSA